MGEVIACIQDISKSYSDGRVIVLDDVSLSIKSGKFLVILGPSGSGKSTLLNLLAGIDKPSAGRVLIGSRQPASDHEWATIRSRKIGFVFQSFNLVPTMTAMENIQLPMFGVTKNNQTRIEKACTLLDQVGLRGRENHYPGDLSGGEKQRVAIARALANSPNLILADEPTGNLDAKKSVEIIDLLEGICREKDVALVVVTHDALIAKRADRCIKIRDGTLFIEESS